jgi:hypothetical protein
LCAFAENDRTREVHLRDSSGQLTVDLLRANAQDFFFV